jgi:hypothetical protein
MGKNLDEAVGALGVRLDVIHQGREINAKVAGMPGDQEGYTDVYVSGIEDTHTGESVQLTADIRAAFKQKYIEEVMQGNY